jgi:4-hydroxybenzoyl-CoA thioesterase
MFVHRRDVQIQWGDCDPANIVYYPRYFAMFDDSTSILFEAAGFSKQDIVRKYGLVGIPMVDTRAKFHIASTHWRLDRNRKPGRELQALELRGHP